MYYPYFRGKQFELITIRENVELIKAADFVPIIEPVKESLGGLKKTLRALIDAEAEAVLVANPYHGDLSTNARAIQELFSRELKYQGVIGVGLALTAKMNVSDAMRLLDLFDSIHKITLIHAGFTDARALSEQLGDSSIARHVFIEGQCSKLYRRRFKKTDRVLVRDGFQRRTNRKHPEIEAFSDLHVTFEDEGMNGFGDFLVVGDDYTTTGGPAYAVAIHVTYIDSDKDDEMFIHHFVSERKNTPTDPAGKFYEALSKLDDEIERPNTQVEETEAIQEFLELHREKHFPGLGYAKKLSMKHHIETLASYFREVNPR